MADSVIKDDVDLYIVGQNIEERQARFQANKQKTITRIARGIYVKNDVNVESVVKAHAARIAQTLFPESAIGYVSAASIGGIQGSQGVQNDTIYLTGAGRLYTVDLPGLKIVRAKGAEDRVLGKYRINDPLGDYEINISTPMQIIIENFKLPSGHPEAGLPMDMFHWLVGITYENAIEPDWAKMEQIIMDVGKAQIGIDSTRLALRYVEDVRLALDAEGYFDEEHGIFDEIPDTMPDSVMPSNLDASVQINWYNKSVGVLNYSYENDKFEFNADNGWLIPLSMSGDNERGIPYFIESNMPEGWLQYVFKGLSPSGVFKDRRFMSNMSAHDLDAGEAFRPPTDKLEGLLDMYAEDGEFNGMIGNLPKDDAFFSEEMSRMWLNGQDGLPMLSGAQLKVPMNLSSWGALMPASNRSFTHILKIPPSHYELENQCVLEWAGMDLARAGGLETPEFCMLKPYPNRPPFLLVERFDIASKDDSRMIFSEDIGSALGLNSSMKARSSIETIYTEVVAKQSTDPEADAKVLFRQAVASYLIGNGDMHAKNLSLLKRLTPGAKAFDTVQLSPVYDFACSQVHASLSHDAQALTVNGKRQGLTMEDYFVLAEHMHIDEYDAKGIIIDTASGIAQRASEMEVDAPKIILQDEASLDVLHKSLMIARDQCDAALQYISDMEGPYFAPHSKQKRAAKGR